MLSIALNAEVVKYFLQQKMSWRVFGSEEENEDECEDPAVVRFLQDFSCERRGSDSLRRQAHRAWRTSRHADAG